MHHLGPPLRWTRLRRDGLVSAGVVGGAVGEEVVDEHADEREQEDDQAPDKLVQRRAVRFDDFNYAMLAGLFLGV